MKYTNKERDEYCEKFWIQKTKVHNLVPYKYRLESYDDDDKTFIILDYIPQYGEIKVDGIDYVLIDVNHYPSFKEIYLAVEDFLCKEEEHGLTLDDISIGTESHYIEGWDEGPFEEIQINVSLPRSIEEIELDIDTRLELNKKYEKSKSLAEQKKQTEEKKLLEELKQKYE